MKRRNQHGAVGKASGRGWIRLGRIATRNCGSGSLQRGGPCCRVELRQTVERLIGDAIVGPVLAHRSEVAVEGTVLLRKNNDVINALQASRYSRRIAQAHASDPNQGTHAE